MRSSPPGWRLIGAASRLVPSSHRDAWRREWEAEAAWAWRRLGGGGPADETAPGLRARLRFRLRVATCVIDALLERKETMTLTGLTDDLRIALRSLGRIPAFTVVAVVTLALGIGATTAVFTLVEGILLRPLPFPDPDRLVAIEHLGRDGQDQLSMSEGLYLLYRDQASSLEDIALYSGTSVNVVTTEGEPERVQAQAVTPGYFETLGIGPALGRGFTPEEGLPDAEPVAVLSDGLWKSAFGGDPSAVGRTLDVNGTARRIVGVMPPDFGYPSRDTRLWLPHVIDPAQAPLAAFGSAGVARLAEGSTPEGLLTELQGLIGRLGELFPGSPESTFLAQVALKAKVQPLAQNLVGDLDTTLWILLGTVGFVLLIACANVANLLLVRAEGRQREMALRVAVGAGRWQVMRTFMAESLVLATAGGVLGIAVAATAVRVSSGLVPPEVPRMAEVHLDAAVLGFTALLALGCALFFGLFPLLRYGVADLASRLQDGEGRSTGSRQRHGLRNGLVVAQVALALMLLVGSGLMFRSFRALRSVNPGFDRTDVLTARLAVPPGEIAGWQETADFVRGLRDRLAAQPGVLAAGWIARAPLAGGVAFITIDIEDHPRAEGELPPFANVSQAEVGTFEALGIPVVEGRAFRPGDGAEGARSVVVSEAFARRWWPEGSALGRRLRLGMDGEDWWQIVGVAGDVHQVSLESPAEEMVYFPLTIGTAGSPLPARQLDIVVRTAVDPTGFAPVLRRELRGMNPRIPLAQVRTMEDVFRQATGRVSFTLTMLGAASGIALLLGLVGIYGVVSYVVSQRTREIGVRMALGASASAVRRMVVRQGLALAVVGVVLGLVAAALTSSFLSSLLYGVGATDPATYATVAAALVAVAAVASWLPARRAAAVDPSRALRTE